MRLFISAKPKSKRTYVKATDDTHFVVAVGEPPDRGAANDAIIHALAAHLGVSRSRLHIIAGISSRKKIIELAPANRKNT